MAITTKKRKILKAFNKLQKLYKEMENEYQKHANLLGLSCKNCEDNCCTSFFHHHTYIEWSFFLYGLSLQPESIQQNIKKKAASYVEQMQKSLSQGISPNIMCPVNDNGLCMMYDYRLMICRLHGVPNFFMLPNGQIKEFLGCFKSQQLLKNKNIPFLNRTPFYQKLAALEQEFIGNTSLPKVKLTLAEMILNSPPKKLLLC